MNLFGDIPSWLDLIIAVAALAGGGAGGGYVAAQHRARLDDRRTIDEFLTRLANAIRTAAIAYELEPESAKYQDHLGGGDYEGFDTSLAAVARLPWPDRAEWLLRRGPISKAVAANAFDRPDDLNELVELFQPTADAITAHRQFAIEYLNPTFGSRWRRTKHKAGLIRRGLLPWNAHVRRVRTRSVIDLERPFETDIDAVRHYDK